MPVLSGAGLFYPVIEEVLNLVRVKLNDTKNNGAGLIFQDTSPEVYPLLNQAIAELQRRLQVNSVPTKTSEVFLVGQLTPVNGPNGLGVPDPDIQQSLGYQGFFDGLTLNADVVLPPDCLGPLVIGQRPTGTGLPYTQLRQAEEQLASILQQQTLGSWEWRGDAIYWNGSIVPMDIRLRYLAAAAFYNSTAVPPSQFPTTIVPIRDSVQALACLIAEGFMDSRLPAGATNPMSAQTDRVIFDMCNRQVRRSQGRVQYRDSEYDDGGDLSLGGFANGWS